MGIRFECPNGHRLNVKAFLAGKRGFCPDCDAKFIVPEVSGGRAALITKDAERANRETNQAATALQLAPPPPVARELLSASVDHQLPDVWYVRLVSGEQYGPANSELMSSWIAQGRVPHDSWIWRTGWDNWKIGSEVMEEFEALPAFAAMPTEAPSSAGVQVGGRSPENYYSARLRQPKAGSRRERARNLSIALGALILLLSVALVLVLWVQQ